MTQHNVYVRKMGDKAIIITVTDWDDFKELEKLSEHEYPDFLVGGLTRLSPYTNMIPTMTINVREARDITAETRGAGLDGIMTGGSNAGPIWGFRKLSDYGF